MQRVTLTLDDDLLESVDRLVAQAGYGSRSEAVRDIVRKSLGDHKARHDAHCLAALSYVYDHETRELSKRLAHVQHEHHRLSVATLHVHLDHESCLEVAILRGSTEEIERVASEVTSQRGVRYGNLHLIPAQPPPDSGEPHAHP